MNINDPKRLDDVRRVLREHKDEIIQQYKAEGAAIGKRHPEDDSYVIVVYLAEHCNLSKKQVEVNNIPLHFVITGRFSLQ